MRDIIIGFNVDLVIYLYLVDIMFTTCTSVHELSIILIMYWYFCLLLFNTKTQCAIWQPSDSVAYSQRCIAYIHVYMACKETIYDFVQDMDANLVNYNRGWCIRTPLPPPPPPNTKFPFSTNLYLLIFTFHIVYANNFHFHKIFSPPPPYSLSTTLYNPI